MPTRQYAPKRTRVGEFGADAAMHGITGAPNTRRLLSSLVLNNTNPTTDANVTVVVNNATPANNAEGLRLTVPSRSSLGYTSHAEIPALTLDAGWGVWFRVNSGGACTAEAHYLEEFTGAPINYDPKTAWTVLTPTYAAILPVSAKRRIVTSINGAVLTGSDCSWYVYVGPGAPGTGTHGLRWAGLALSNPTNYMSSIGVPLHLDAGDGLWAYADAATVSLQINYMEEQ